MEHLSLRDWARWLPTVAATVGWLIISMTGAASASDSYAELPPEVNPAFRYLLDLAGKEDGTAFDSRQIEPYVDFLQSSTSSGALYRADTSFDAPSAFHQFTVNAGLQKIVDYTLDADIPSYFLWPSSLRLSRWTQVDGGLEQLTRLKAAFANLEAPFILRGAEFVTITPDQHTGAYYSYDVDKMVIVSPFREGRLMISVYQQQAPSAVGKRGWVLGEDNEWSYLYTQEKGLNVNGLGWANTYMYDSFGITVYYEPARGVPTITAGVVSWVKAGWASINMVQPKHIHHGLVRVSDAFTAVLEDPRLPEPAKLAETFSRSKDLPTPVLREYAGNYLAGLRARISSSSKIWKDVAEDFDSRTLLEQMSRDELYAVLALDYFKKLLDRNPVMESHPF